jgi:hypothetical protein
MGKESAYTSLNQIPAAFKAFHFGRRNLDIGGGKYDHATGYLIQHGTINLVLDPFNRTEGHNTLVKLELVEHWIDSITCFNVLNVIQNK